MTEIDQPQIVVDRGTDGAISRRIETIDRAIHRSPEAFTAAFQNLGEQATANVVDLADIDTVVPTASRKPELLIKEFLGNRYDIHSEYDESTETLLAQDATHKELVDSVRSKVSVTVRKGQMSSETRANPEADEARDKLRRYRFGVYLGRVSAAKTNQSSLQPAV